MMNVSESSLHYIYGAAQLQGNACKSFSWTSLEHMWNMSVQVKTLQ